MKDFAILSTDMPEDRASRAPARARARWSKQEKTVFHKSLQETYLFLQKSSKVSGAPRASARPGGARRAAG